jgi:EAL domain-containing protein (putative c-di-GMP-specific phosphodiesterase class I)
VDTVEFSLYLVQDSLIDKADSRFKAIMRWSDVDLFRQPLSFIFPADAHGRVDKLLESRSGLFEGIVFPRVPIRVKTGGYVNFDMRMAELDNGNRRLDFFKPGQNTAAADTNDPPVDMYSFFNFVEDLLQSPYDGDMGLTMVSVDGLRIDGALSEHDRTAARAEIELGLKARALGGKLGKLDEASYGLITKGDFDEAEFDREMELVAGRLNLPLADLSIRSANVEIDDKDIPSAQLKQALGHSRGVFLGEIQDENGLDKLSGVVDGIEHNRRLIADALKKYKYRVSERMVTDNIATTSISRLQQGKVNLEGQIRLPDEILVMADHPDLALKHDLAQLEDLIRMRKQQQGGSQQLPDFYEVCRNSLIQSAFSEKLSDLLKQYNTLPLEIGFRVKGMPPVKRGGLHWEAVNKLAAIGHPMWIDRFGDAVMSADGLACLRDGFIELPAGLMKTLAGHFEGKDLMGKLIETWRALNVTVVAVDLPDYELKTMAQELGVSVTVEDAPEMLAVQA